ncbi:MAG TPA: NAD(P) transhydrogenase subunit alpha [Candidatus Nanoarchaeia archaeon]|nr:NAD(P) transhydrogenase subunit alpha [Candidatus Nanoarchaeia archaeon]
MIEANDILVNLLIFVMASFLGLELIRNVSRLLHTPLMSLTNAISSVSLVAALLVMAHAESSLVLWLGIIALTCATINAIGGFMITERILKMFRKGKKNGSS